MADFSQKTSQEVDRFILTSNSVVVEKTEFLSFLSFLQNFALPHFKSRSALVSRNIEAKKRKSLKRLHNSSHQKFDQEISK